ncbi:MAG: transposase, partial [Akkermansiaceae bacterium]
IKRRTRVAGLFPNEKSVLRLVTAILMETSEEWETGKAYLTLTAQNQIPNTTNHQKTAAGNHPPNPT